MAVSVHIPTRISVDPGALLERQGCIAEALSKAALRALTNSCREVLEKRGGYVGVECHWPDFTWTGNGLGHVPHALRAIIEERITGVLSAAVSEAGIYDRTEAVRETVAPMSGEVSEVIDGTRHLMGLGRYVVPNYQYKGKDTAIKVDEGEEVIGGTPAKPAPHHAVFDWEPFTTAQRFAETSYLERKTRHIRPTSSGYLGVIFKNSNRQMAFHIDKYLSGEEASPNDLFWEGDMGGLMQLTPKVNGKQLEFVMKEFAFPASARYRLRFYANGGEADAQSKVIKKYYESFIRSTILKHSHPKSSVLTQQEIAEGLEEKVNEHVSKLAEQIPSDVKCFLELSINGQPSLILSNIELPPDLDIELIPLVTLREPVRDGTFIGTSGSSGKGKSSGAGANAGANQESGAGDQGGEGESGAFIYTGVEKAGGAYFPSVDGGIDLTCAPYLSEPSMDDMGSDGNGLRTLVDEIAYQLHMPKCNFAAHFCLNAAAVLGSRALAVGTVAVDSRAITKKIETGKGNLGSLDFVPTASPAIQLMRHLGGVTARITELMNLLSTLR